MAIQTYSIDQDIAEKFKEATPEQKTSEELEKLMADYLDEDIEHKKPDIKILDREVVTRKRRDLMEKIVSQELFTSSKPSIYKELKSQGVYYGDSGKHHFKEAVRFLHKLDSAPLRVEKDKVVAEEFTCRNEGCEAVLTLPGLARNDWSCPSCGRGYEV